MEGKARILGAQRNLSEAVSSVTTAESAKQVILRVNSGANDDHPLSSLEQGVAWFANHNSNYTNVEEDEFHVLVDEVLNNSIRSVLVFADLSASFGDAEVYSLSMAFQYNLSIEALTLSSVNVGDESVSMLCEALVRSRVNYIDLTNTLLEDEAGRSLAALAHVNPYLRTVIIGDTLISEDILDEIDVACQFNQSNFEGNDDSLDEGMFKSADLGRLKHRLGHIIRSKHRKVHYCVAHLFGCCPNGDMCLFSHTLSNSGVDDCKGSLADKVAELFSAGGNWEEKLPPRPQDGASWRNPDEGAAAGPRLNIKKRQDMLRRKEEERVRGANPLIKRGPVVVSIVVATSLAIAVLLKRILSP